MSNRETYNIIYRRVDGNKCVGYRIHGDRGNEYNVSKEQLVRLIDAGVVTDCKYRRFNGEIQFSGIGKKLRDLKVFDIRKNAFRGESPSGDKYRLVTRVLRGNALVGGIIVSNTGQIEKVSGDKLKVMAGDGKIVNVQCTNNNTVLRYKKDNYPISIIRLH